MKKLIGLLIGMLLITGCHSTPPSDQCANWENAIRIYEVALAAGHKPSEDETRIYTAAKALFAVYCAKTSTSVELPAGAIVELPSGQKAIGLNVRQPERITVMNADGTKTVFRRKIPFSSVECQVGGHLVLSTFGPIYTTTDPTKRGNVWTVAQPWLQGQEPRMLPIK